MIYKTKVVLAVVGLLLSTVVGFNVVGVTQISASNYLVYLEVTNNSPIGCVVHSAYAEVYDEWGRHIADAWIWDRDLVVEPRSTTSFVVEIELLIPWEDLERLSGDVRVETTVAFSIWLYSGSVSSTDIVSVEELVLYVGEF